MLRRWGCVCLTMLCVWAVAGIAPPVAAAAARDQLAQAIATTRGSYLVYNFGSGFPAPMLDAGGRWYEMSNGGRLMIVKSASQRLSPRLLVDSHQGFQSRCERTPGARTREGLMQASETYAPLQAWQVLGRPTIAVNANFFDVRSQQAGSWKSHRLQFTAGRVRRQHRRPGPGQPGGDRHPGLRRQAGALRR